MQKKIIVAICAIILIGAGYGYFGQSRGLVNEQTNKDFLSTLKGEIVYLNGDGNNATLYKISATGDNKTLLYKDALRPVWTNGGKKISFASHSVEFWDRYSMNSDGSGVTLERSYDGNSVNEFLDSFGQVKSSREVDIIVEAAKIYFIDGSGARHLVYTYDGPSSPWGNAGPSEASWGPDKNYIIFRNNNFGNGKNEIMIVSKDGAQIAKLAEGRDPDWKYDGKNYPQLQ